MTYRLPAGDLDRRITIERSSYVDDGYGKQPVWTSIGTVWAKRRPMRGNESFDLQARTASVPIVFTIRWSSSVADLSPSDRIDDNGVKFDIASVNELGRRVALEIYAVANLVPQS